MPGPHSSHLVVVGFLSILLAHAASAPSGPSVPPVSADYRTEPCREFTLTSLVRRPILEALYRQPTWGRIEPAKLMPSGAYAANALYEQGKITKWRIEEQRYAANAVEAWLITGDEAALVGAFKVFKWGFDRQLPNGGFAGTDAFHSCTFMLEAIARTLVLFKETGDARFAPFIAEHIPKTKALAHWIVEHAEAAARTEAPYAHRRWLIAAGLGLASRLAGDHSLAVEARRFAMAGIALQDPTGFNPEKGGFDVGYNTVGLYYAAHYYTTLRCDEDAALMQDIRRWLDRSLAWQASKTLANGDIDAIGSTRINIELNPLGVLKTTNYGGAIRAFEMGAAILHSSEYQEQAARIARFRWRVEATRP